MQELFGLRVIPDKGPMYCSVCSFYKPRILYLVQYRRPSSASRSGRKPFKSLESDPYRPPSTKGEVRPPKTLVTPYGYGYSTDTGNTVVTPAVPSVALAKEGNQYRPPSKSVLYRCPCSARKASKNHESGFCVFSKYNVFPVRFRLSYSA